MVTVLFVDIVGSTALVDRLDPEDVRALQRSYFDTVGEVLRRWHGVVEKYIGDAVMALFGARDSDGFDAYRAVRAGLEMQRALDRRALAGGPRLRVRIGVATGEAVVDLAGARDGGHGAASGAVITTAARLQGYAPPGGVALCAATHRATAGLVEQCRIPPVALAGKASPVDVWHATALVRPAPVRHDGPFLGRRREVAAARDQLVRAVRDRRPRWVSLVGPAGSGRSRLLSELSRSVASVDEVPVRWCLAHCPPYPDHPLAPVAELVRGHTGLRATDPPARVRRRLAAALAGLVPPERLPASVSTLARLLARPDAGDAAEAAALWREALLALAARQPVVVAVDDVDRAAPEVADFLRALLAAATERRLPLAVVTAHRPQWAEPLPRPAVLVELRPLGAVDSGRLLRHLLRRAGRPVALVDRLLPLVGGSPGHAAAYVRSLVEGADNAAELPVPEPVRRAVDARLDRLDGDQRAALMAVASRATDCPAPTVDRLLGWTPGRARPVLRSLVALGLLTSGPAGGYAVAEVVVRQVAYARLPRAVRAEFARRAAGPRHLGPAPVPAAQPVRRPAGTPARPAPGPGTDRRPRSAPVHAVPDPATPRRPAGTPAPTAPNLATLRRRAGAAAPAATTRMRTAVPPAGAARTASTPGPVRPVGKRDRHHASPLIRPPRRTVVPLRSPAPPAPPPRAGGDPGGPALAAGPGTAAGVGGRLRRGAAAFGEGGSGRSDPAGAGHGRAPWVRAPTRAAA
ncbi:adenylate/guanylate cyclase domain-containing protein [Micromonospora sp. C28SCA-DRY-2]|uniref:AAA family ATPase n=1 Tax=Micromonospora sp. C28SCA-DRY-2 TaxID=3059522 RepID=UPI0026752103|nr:adenylate/guanylate cyclase domain-containing protein [Micromonospora sp. C28SCA-DRY-2]MDO3705247.1 adenylate/guanylate cyclase domain-containing protein [Micromonospora sp. C28SCA-DRY-2]